MSQLSTCCSPVTRGKKQESRKFFDNYRQLSKFDEWCTAKRYSVDERTWLRLTSDDHIGRMSYWFGNIIFSQWYGIWNSKIKTSKCSHAEICWFPFKRIWLKSTWNSFAQTWFNENWLLHSVYDLISALLLINLLLARRWTLTWSMFYCWVWPSWSCSQHFRRRVWSRSVVQWPNVCYRLSFSFIIFSKACWKAWRMTQSMERTSKVVATLGRYGYVDAH